MEADGEILRRRPTGLREQFNGATQTEEKRKRKCDEEGNVTEILTAAYRWA
jgi:hypothetical protein